MLTQEVIHGMTTDHFGHACVTFLLDSESESQQASCVIRSANKIHGVVKHVSHVLIAHHWSQHMWVSLFQTEHPYRLDSDLWIADL